MNTTKGQGIAWYLLLFHHRSQFKINFHYQEGSVCKNSSANSYSSMVTVSVCFGPHRAHQFRRLATIQWHKWDDFWHKTLLIMKMHFRWRAVVHCDWGSRNSGTFSGVHRPHFHSPGRIHFAIKSAFRRTEFDHVSYSLASLVISLTFPLHSTKASLSL